MKSITFGSVSIGTNAGKVTVDHLGASSLFHSDQLVEGSKFDQINDIVHSHTLRFPGGAITETHFDQSDATDKEMLDQFLQFCALHGSGAMIVIPTHRYFMAGAPNHIDPDAKNEVQSNVRYIVDKAAALGVAIKGFETGNEFQNPGFTWTPAQFAKLQAQMADWIHDEIGETADIFVQAGRTDAENAILRDAFIEDDKDDLDLGDVDGIVTHIYYGPTGRDMKRIGAIEHRTELLDKYWGSYNLDTIVTEWNASEDSEFGGASSVYGLARLAVLTRGFGDIIGYGIDQAILWTTIAPGPNGRASLAQIDSNGDLYLLPTGYWYELMSSTLVNTKLVTDYGASAAFEDDDGDFAGYSYVYQGLGSKADDYHLIYSSGVNSTLDFDLNLMNLMSNGSYVYASIIRNTGTAAPDHQDAEASVMFITDLGSQMKVRLEAYEFLQINVVSGHGVTYETDAFHDTADELFLTDYRDKVRTYDGNDIVHAQKGNDRILLGAGSDIAYGGRGSDKISGQRGNDNLFGNSGADEIYGGNGRDRLRGNNGDDALNGGGGNDKLFGKSGADEIYGGNGRDRLRGNNGDDTLNGGGGNDKLYGNCGSDVFIFAGNFANDKICDFASGDRIDLRTFDDINGLADLDIAQVGDAVIVSIGRSHIAVLNFDVQDLSASDFMFAA